MKKALWSGRFKEGMDGSTLEFTSSLDVDTALAFYDIMGSLAHVKMLRKCKILPDDDADSIIVGLLKILKELESSELRMDDTLEDVHTNIEVRLTELIGAAGGRMHTARSRNDQVATDLRMFLRDAVLDAVRSVDTLITDLVHIAESMGDKILPGFTHTQHAQPVTIGHHMMAHAFRLNRDAERFMESFERMNMCPLGAAALAGTTFPINRDMTSSLLGFRAPSENSMDAVSDRDFVSEILFNGSMLSIHLSSMAEELVLWSSTEFGFIEIDDKYTTGSSIMPQKKNSDIAELIRGRTGGVIGDLVNMLVTLKALPLTYNRDLQEDKGPVMRSMSNIVSCTNMMSKMISTVKFNESRLYAMTKEGYINATDLADYLVTKGMPFREAHAAVGAAVRYCITEKRHLEELKLSELKGFADVIGKDVFEILPIEKCAERRNSYGGTSPSSVDVQTIEAMTKVMRREDEIRSEASLIKKCWEYLCE